MIDTYIRINGEYEPAVVTFATPNDIKELTSWRFRYGRDQDQQSIDIVEYTSAALYKKKVYSHYERYPQDWTSFSELTQQPNSQEETAGLFVLRCHALDNSILGFVFVRRTWDGALTLDYLATRPKLNKFENSGFVVKRVGFGLFVAVCSIAGSYGAKYIWWETSLESVDFYCSFLPLERSSILMLSSNQYREVLAAIA